MVDISVSNITVIKAFFEANGGRKVTMDEFKALTSEERQQLADMIRALDVTVTPAV